MGTELLRCEGLSVERSGTRILDDVSLSVGEGEAVLVQGPSGAGKTTLFHVLGLLEPFTDGRLTFDGTDVTGLSGRERARLRREEIGVVFQDFRLVPDLTAWENARLPQEHAGDGDEHWVGTVFRRLGLEELRDRYPAALSGGEKQRVAIARALANHPRLLLVDEPTGQLDAETSERVVELLFEVQEMTGAALLCISHDRSLASAFERRYRLRDGELADVEDAERDIEPKSVSNTGSMEP